MIDFFYYHSPNTRKVLIALEEVELDYRVCWIDLASGDQHLPGFREVNPNGKVPAIVDHDGPGGMPLALFESGAILEYLAEKTGRLLPTDLRAAWQARAWVHWQVANQGPMCGQATHFLNYAADRGVHDDYATNRYTTEAARSYEVLNGQLAEQNYIAGEFSIADIACFPWTRVAKGHGVSLDDYPNVKAWSQRIKNRPSVRVTVPDERDDNAKNFNYTDAQWKQLFGTLPPAVGVTE
jgi:GSH-dependent disulfide-bond oxidoreductase